MELIADVKRIVPADTVAFQLLDMGWLMVLRGLALQMEGPSTA